MSIRHTIASESTSRFASGFSKSERENFDLLEQNNLRHFRSLRTELFAEHQEGKKEIILHFRNTIVFRYFEANRRILEEI